jgi:hypothetical protein
VQYILNSVDSLSRQITQLVMRSDQKTTAADYRKLAEECFCLASRSFPEPVRAAYIDLARLSLEAASRANDSNTEHGE